MRAWRLPWRSGEYVKYLVKASGQVCDQMDATENRFRRLFFSDQKRLDHVFQRSKLHALLRFYAGRAARYGFFSGDGNQVARKYMETLRLLSRLDGGISTMRSASRGYIVDLAGNSGRRSHIVVLSSGF
jgi:hypothetical protein